MEGQYGFPSGAVAAPLASLSRLLHCDALPLQPQLQVRLGSARRQGAPVSRYQERCRRALAAAAGAPVDPEG